MPLPKLTEPLAIVVKGSVFVLFTADFLASRVPAAFFLVGSVPECKYRPGCPNCTAYSPTENTDDSEPFTRRI